MLRICRYKKGSQIASALYHDTRIVNLQDLDNHICHKQNQTPNSLDWENPLLFLPHGSNEKLGRNLFEYWNSLSAREKSSLELKTDSVQLLPPLPIPPKFLLLAGNYAEHLEESGMKAEEREDTFPYVFYKPPTTTLRGSGETVLIPSISPNFIDWEAELGVIIGKHCKGVSADEALTMVAGYTVVNDISNRKFRPNPNRKQRPRDGFFDWLHGKWFDSSAPVGPCITSAHDLNDPQDLFLRLDVNGEIQQESHTRRMIFSVAEIIEFISSFVTLEPGDLISTGTAAGVGSAKEKFLRHGDKVMARIEHIGILESIMQNESTS